MVIRHSERRVSTHPPVSYRQSNDDLQTGNVMPTHGMTDLKLLISRFLYVGSIARLSISSIILVVGLHAQYRAVTTFYNTDRPRLGEDVEGKADPNHKRQAQSMRACGVS